jgi:hypothetical protein
MLRDIIGHDTVKSKLKKLSPTPPKVILFSGPEGVGKKHTAFNFIDEVHNGYLTGKLFHHPDIYVFEPTTKVFKLELIDKVKQNIYTSPFELERKFFILNKIDLMNKESANACLKIFEDCPEYIHFILIATNYDNVLDTIRSRSVHFSFQPIQNLRQYFPTMSDLQIKVMRGCIGNKDLVQKTDIKFIYNDIKNFIETFNTLYYSDVIDWSVSKESYEIEFIVDMLFIVAEDMFKEGKQTFVIENILSELKILKDKLPLNINTKMHFKNSLLQAKHNLEKFN